MAAYGIRVTSNSGALTVTITGPSGGTPHVYSDEALTAAVSLPATVADATSSTFYVASPGTYSLSVKDSSGTQIANTDNTTRPVDLESPGTVSKHVYDVRLVADVGLTDAAARATYAPVTPTARKVAGANLYGAGDQAVAKLIELSLQQLRDWLTWCQAAGSSQPWITESGWPNRGNQAADAQRWQAIGDAIWSWADTENIPVVYWSARQGLLSATDLMHTYYASGGGFPSGTLDSKQLQAELIEKYAASATPRGVNLPDGYSGFSVGIEANDAAGGDNLNTGTYGTSYSYGTAPSFAYLAAQGHKIVRILFRLERFFSGAGGTSAAINAAEVAAMNTALAAAHAAGLQVVLCPANFGLYYLNVAGTPTAQFLGAAGFTQAQFAAMWTALSAAFKGNPAVAAYELMGEPAGCSTATWHAASQAALTAIRANSDTTLVLVDGSSFAQLQAWIQNDGATGWITDTANNFQYTAHFYPGDAGGVFAASLDSYGATAEKTLLAQVLAPGLSMSGPATGAKIETMPVHQAGAGLTLTAGSIYVAAFTAPFTWTVTTLKAWVGAAASSGLTAARMAIGMLNQSDDITYVAETASDTTLFNATFAGFSRALDGARGGPTSYTFVRGQRYGLVVFQAGTTAAKIAGGGFVAASIGIEAGHPFNAWVSAAGQADLPAPGTQTVHTGYTGAAGRLYVSAS